MILHRKIFIFALLSLLPGCITVKPAPLPMSATFDKEGHRGCRGLMPENTLPAMLHALDLGVTTLEMDAVITKDGEVILSHEPWMGHEIATKPGGGHVTEEEEKSLNIYRMTYEEVTTFDVGLRPHPRFPRQRKMAAVKPLLRDVIDSVEAWCRQKGRTVRYNIETKCTSSGDGIYHPGPEEFTDRLMAVVQEKEITARVIIQSFDVRTLQYLHRQYPSVKTSLLVEGPGIALVQDPFRDLGFVPDIYSPEHTFVTQRMIDGCHKKGVLVVPWTVNDRHRLKKLKAMGVDGLITDYPDLFAELEKEGK